MPRESIVEIPSGSGNKYRYAYDPSSKAMKYLGPVGSAPEITESEFIRSPLTLEEFIMLPKEQREERALGNILEWLSSHVDDVEVEEVDQPNEWQSGGYEASGYDQGRPFIVTFGYDPDRGTFDEEFEFTGDVQVL